MICGKTSLVEILVVAMLFLPACSLLAGLAGVAAWTIWEIEGGSLAFVIVWIATMTAVQITLRRLLTDLAGE